MVDKLKIPTMDEYNNYDGAYCRNLWKQLPDSWRCPGCDRSKFEIMRWTTRYFKLGVGKCNPYKGWMAGLHRHHDHSQELRNARFAEIVICDQCNAADGRAKLKLKLSDSFSFSPLEIRKFIKPIPHGRHGVDFEKAQKIYEELSNE